MADRETGVFSVLYDSEVRESSSPTSALFHVVQAGRLVKQRGPAVEVSGLGRRLPLVPRGWIDEAALGPAETAALSDGGPRCITAGAATGSPSSAAPGLTADLEQLLGDGRQPRRRRAEAAASGAGQPAAEAADRQAGSSSEHAVRHDSWGNGKTRASAGGPPGDWTAAQPASGWSAHAAGDDSAVWQGHGGAAWGAESGSRGQWQHSAAAPSEEGQAPADWAGWNGSASAAPEEHEPASWWPAAPETGISGGDGYALLFSGSVRHIDGDAETAVIECREAAALFGTSDVLTAHDGLPVGARAGTALCFALREQGLVTAPETVPGSVFVASEADASSNFVGTLKAISAGWGGGKQVGWISSVAAQEVYSSDVYMHGSMLEGLSIGDAVSFMVHRNAKGQPQASVGSVARLGAPAATAAASPAATAGTGPGPRNTGIDAPVYAPGRVVPLHPEEEAAGTGHAVPGPNGELKGTAPAAAPAAAPVAFVYQ